MHDANRISSGAHDLPGGFLGRITEEDNPLGRFVTLAHLLGRIDEVLDAQTLVFAKERVLVLDGLRYCE